MPKDMSTLNAAKAAKMLATPMSFENRIITRATWLECLAERGYKLRKKVVPKYTFNRVLFNRMGGGGQQEAYDKKMKETKEALQLNAPDDSEYFDICPTEADYFKQVAAHLG
jgi:hypothetical protein